MITFADLAPRLALPVVAAPMFLVSGPELVTAACLAGVIGAFPTINARTPEELADWLIGIATDLAGRTSRKPDDHRHRSPPISLSNVGIRGSALISMCSVRIRLKS